LIRLGVSVPVVYQCIWSGYVFSYLFDVGKRDKSFKTIKILNIVSKL